jgi:hypothetical protein
LNKGQIPLVNYNLRDAYRLLDSLGGILCSTNYFKAPEMQEAIQKIELGERLEIIHSLMAKHLIFLQNFSDIGVIKKNFKKLYKRKNKMFIVLQIFIRYKCILLLKYF